MPLIRESTPAEGVLLLTLNRPESRNALSLELRQEMTDALTRATDAADVGIVVLTGGDAIFAAGADLHELAASGPRDMLLRDIERHWRAVAAFPKPLIAAVNGPAFGGGFELAMHADIILAARTARFALPEVTLGLMPGGGGTQRLIRLIGKARAMRYLLTGDRIAAAEAASMGIVSELVDDDNATPAAIALASRMAKLPPLALRQIKEATLAGADGPLATGLLLERRASQVLLDTDDLQEGIAAFFEKRPPVFTGH